MKIPAKRHEGYDPAGDCGKGKCPVCARNNAMLNIKSVMQKKEFTSDGVAPFVGRFGYPNVNLGILAPPEETKDSWLYDAPKHWSSSNFQIPKIVKFRSSLLNSRYNVNIKKSLNLLELSQDIAMASNPVDVEVKLSEAPKFKLNTDSYMAPTGPNAKLKNAKITQNPKIHTKVYKVYGDIDLKANDAVNYLYENNFDENFLSKILSVGTIGLKKDRKLVPTRWSITATDDMIGKKLISEIKNCSEVNEYSAFFGSYLGNYYLILCFPEVWSYELFETYVPANWEFNKELKCSTDYEPYSGRKDYASNTAGGYYTVRLAVLEKLKEIKRQASVLALRFITDDYSMPLGVWVTREATRKAMDLKSIKFSSKELMIEYARKVVRKKFNYDLDFSLKNSLLLKNIKQQTKLVKFI
jgi:DNA repair protein NreA